MAESLLEQAKVWGFVCQCNDQDNWQIFPEQKTERWKLQLVGNRWLLIISEVPQVCFWPDEASAFLERHRYFVRKG